ncbi:MAG: ATP-binding cassette domain-containing protein [Clostridia bacterium]
MSILKIINLNKYYKQTKDNVLHVLKNINLEFRKGELVSIIGESGSGKSTLMNLIGGLDTDYDGEILVNNKDLKLYSENKIDEYRKDKVGFIFQSFNLIPHLSVLDNVVIGCTLTNMSKSKRNEKGIKLLDELGLKNQYNKKPNQLSGGQKQRVAIARALINDPEIIIADEPTGSLDSETSKQILDIITNISKQGKLVIMVTHSNMVASLSSRIIKIKDGIIAQDDENLITDNYDDVLVDGIKKENLSFFSAIKLAFKNMKEKFVRNILIALGSSIGIMSIIVMLSIGTGIKGYITDQMNSFANPSVIEVNMKSDENNANTDIKEIPMEMIQKEIKTFKDSDIEKLSKINNVTKVEKAYSSIMATANTIKFDDKKSIIQMLMTTSSYLTKENVKYGSMPKDNEIMVSYSIAKRFSKDNVESLIGKKCNFNVQVKNKVISKDLVISGIYGNEDGGMTGNMTQAFVTYDYLSNIYKENNLVLEPTNMYLVSDNIKNVENIKKDVISLGYEGSRQEQMIGMFTEMLDMMTYILASIAAISLFVSAIMILVVLYISVIERTNEIGVLKAIGARRKDIKRIFISESFLVGLFGGLFGILNAFILLQIISKVIEKMFSLTNVVSLSLYDSLFALGVSIVISVVAGLYPAAKAAKLDPIISLRHE